MTKAEAVPWSPVIVAVAPNGARKIKADHPAIPLSADEIGRCAAACAEAGAAMIHLHVRDRDGGHLLDGDAYRAAISAVRREAGPDIVIQVTTEAVGRYSPAEQMAVVRDVRPEAVSLAVREIVPEDGDERMAADFLAWLDAEGILPQFILYSREDLIRFDALIARGVVPGARRFVLFVLGRYATGRLSSPADLLPFLTGNKRGHEWAVCAFGAREAACAITSAGLGGHARVGFENNLLLPDGEIAADNAALVAVVARGATGMGRPLATADEARAIMAETGKACP